MSSAPAVSVPGPAKDTSTYKFTMKQSIPSYLLAMVIGDIERREVGPRSQIYADPAVLEAAAKEFANVEEMLSAAEKIFGPYPWERYDMVVMPPSFPFGGMENPRLTFVTPALLTGDRSAVNVLEHEITHSWIGNLITNASANDFYLNEGLTTWGERRIGEARRGIQASLVAATLGRKELRRRTG